MSSKKALQSLIARESAEWLDRQPAKLGDGTGTEGGIVLTDTAGIYNARTLKGKVIGVYNQAHVPPIPDLNVVIGRRRSLPNLWQIISTQEVYDRPIARGQIEYHHEQHEENGGDQLFLDRKQINQLSVRVSDAANFIVKVIGAIVPTASGNVIIANQNMDLSAYVVISGAKIIAIESDDSGALTIAQGTAFGAAQAATQADLPPRTDGKYPFAGIMLHEGQTELSDSDIFPIIPLPSSGGGTANVGAAIHAAAADTPLDADEFGFWDVVAGLLRKITWANVKATLKTYFDTLYAPIAKGVTNGDGHDHNGGDGAAIVEAAITLADNVTNDVSISKHGFAPKAPNDSTKYLDGTGAYTVPAGSGGGLTYNAVTVTTGNVSAAEGNHYDCTIAGLTADRDFNLPTPSAAGKKVALRVLDGDDTYELIIKANSVEITRLFVAGEYMEFMSYGTGAGDWKASQDGRIPCLGEMDRITTNSNTTNAANTPETIDWNNAPIDQGNITDVTNNRFIIRRTGKYRGTFQYRPVANVTDQKYIELMLYKNIDGTTFNGTTEFGFAVNRVAATGAATLAIIPNKPKAATAGDFIYARFATEEANIGMLRNDAGDQSTGGSWVSIEEVL